MYIAKLGFLFVYILITYNQKLNNSKQFNFKFVL